MNLRYRPSPEAIVRDGRRNSWILIVPNAAFLTGESVQDSGVRAKSEPPPEPQAGCETARSNLERTIPFVMLGWAVVVWSFLLYSLARL